MNILDTIIAHKKNEVAERKQLVSTAQLALAPHFELAVPSLKASVLDKSKTGIIAEFKRKSPSKGVINDAVSIEEVTTAYAKHGASGISVLTDQAFFGGHLEDLQSAAALNLSVPLLRKDFMIDEYQLVEAKAAGAAVILLIAACLTPDEVKRMAIAAKNIGLEVLLEIHNEEELAHLCDGIDLVGVNNRNLKNFEVSIENSLHLIKKIPSHIPAIAESGISKVDTIVTLRNAGFRGFLIGENFMRHAQPSIVFADFVHELQNAANLG